MIRTKLTKMCSLYVMLIMTLLVFGFIACSKNHAPIITDLTAEPDSLGPSETSVLKVAAEDEDEDLITFSWTTSNGALSANTGDSVNWTAPDSAGVYSVTVTAIDEQDAADTASVDITVYSTILEVPDVDFEVHNEGQMVRFAWYDIENADFYRIFADDVVVDTAYGPVYDAWIQAKKYGVTAFSVLYGESDPGEVDLKPVTTNNVEVWGDTDPDTSHHSGYGFNTLGVAITYSLSDTSNWPYIDHWISSYISPMLFASPDIWIGYSGPFNNERNYTANSGSTIFDDLDMALPPGSYWNYTDIIEGSVYFLWIDPTANGWDNNTDHFAKIKVVAVSGLKVTMKIAYQVVPGLRWLVTP